MASKEMVRQGEERREEMVRFITAYIQEHGYGPSIKEVGDHVGIKSPNAVRNHLYRLRDEGRIKMDARVPRSIRLA